MTEETNWSIVNVTLSRLLPLVVATASIGFSTPVEAAGTAAGSNIVNTATATYDGPGGVPVNVSSNTVTLKVDELLNVTVASADPGDVAVTPGSTAQVLSFTVTNTGNGPEAFRLTPTTAIGGDQFDPTATSIVLDTNGNGVYDAGVDTVYTAGSNDPVLAADGSTKVFILSTIPGGSVNGDRGQANLTAAAVTGTGSPGTSFAGAGQNGGDAVVGTTTASATDKGFYLIQSATVSFTKSAAVLDPFGGSKNLPGAVITYSLVATISGSGSLANIVITDPIPIGTTYQPGTLTLQAAALTDAVDADSGEVGGGNVKARLGTVAAGQTRTVIFKVKIN
jgi:uncharacterized repeat protein (TIGR01451 family)